MSDLIRAAEMSIVPLDVFKSTVKRHLTDAIAALDTITTAPRDIFDPGCEALLDALEGLDQFTMALGRDERKREDVEVARERKVAAKARNPEIERVVMLIDQRIQKAVEMIGMLDAVPSTQWALAPMHADMLIKSVVQLLDLFPTASFAEDRVNILHIDRDPTIAGIVALMRARKAAQVAA